MDLQLATSAADGITVIEARGEIDLYTAPRLDQALKEAFDAGARRLALDLTEVTFLDSTALKVLIRWQQELTEQGGEVAIACDRPPLVKIFEIAGLDGLFKLHPSRQQALAALAG